MSLSFNTTVSLTTSSVQAGCTDEGNNHVIIVESSSNTLRKFDLATGSQSGSNISIMTTAKAVAMIDSLSAVVMGTTNGNVDFVELASGYKTTATGGAFLAASNRGQRIASDTANKQAIAVCNTAATVTKINGNSFTASNTTINTAPSSGGAAGLNCVIFIGSDRYLIGTAVGEVIMVDFALNVYGRMTCYVPNTNILSGTGAIFPSIVNMAWSNGLLLVTFTDGIAQLYEWDTKALLKQTQWGANQPYHLSNVHNGLVLGGAASTSANNMVVEYDMELRPLHVEGYIFNNTTNNLVAMGINTSNGRVWAIEMTGEKIHLGTMTARSSTTDTLSLPGSTGFARLLVFQGSTGNGKLQVDRYLNHGRTIRLPASGTTVWGTIQIGDGEPATFNGMTKTL